MNVRSPRMVQRRYLIAVAVVAVLLLLVALARSWFLSSIDSDWTALKQDADSTQARIVTERMLANISRLHSTALEALPVAPTPMEARAMAARSLRERMHDARLPGLAFELRDTMRALLAYGGIPLPGNGSTSPRKMDVVQGTPYTMLMVRLPWVDSSGVRHGTLEAGIPLAVTVPVNRRFLDADGLVEGLSAEFDIDLRAEPLPLTRKPSERVYVSIAPEGEALAVLSFEGTEREAYREQVAFQFDRVLAALVLALALLAGIPVLTAFLHIPLTSLSVTLAAVYVTGWRYVFFSVGVGRHVFPESMSDPSAYASSFAGGIAGSPAELLLSMLLLCVIVGFAYIRVLRDRERPMGSIPAVLGLLLVSLALPLILRASAAVLRGMVVDSSFNYDDVGALFDDTAYSLMLINAWLLTLAFGFALLALYLIAKRSQQVFAQMRGMHRMHPVMISLGVIGFLLVSADPLLPVWAYVVLALLLAVPLHVRLPLIRERSTNLSAPIIFATTIGTLVCVAMFGIAMEKKRSAEIEAIAIDLSRPVDGWSHVLMEQTLQVIARSGTEDMEAVGGESEYGTAFRLWSVSPLSRLQNNSAIMLIDSTGAVVSRFAVGNDPFLLSMHTLSTTMEKTEGIVQSVYRQLDDREKRYYKGYIDVPGSGRPLFAVVVLEALDPLQITHNAVDLLRSTPTTRSLAPEDRFIISRFHAGRLRQTSEPRLERGMPLPIEARRVPSDGGNGVWGTLSIKGSALHTYFIAGSDPGEVLAISRGGSELVLAAYRWLRIALIFAMWSTALLILIAVLAGRFRARPRLTFARKLQFALLAVAAIPLLLIWVAGRDFIMDTTRNDMMQQVTDNLDVLRSNLATMLPESAYTDPAASITDALCQDARLRSGKDVNVYAGADLIATSKPELYRTGLLNSRLNPEAWDEIVLRGRDLHVATEQIGEFSYYVGYRALRGADGLVKAMISTPTLFERNRAEEVYIRASAAVFLWITLMAVIVLLLSEVLARQISRPLHEFLRATQDITAGNLDRTVRVHGTAEIVDLMTAFNTMTRRLRESKQELAAAERELAWKEMARQVAHEIRNPLTPMKLSAQHLQRAWRDGAANIGEIIEKVTRTLIDQIDSLSRISDEFSRFGRMPRRMMTDVDVADALRETVELFRTHEHIRFDVRIDEPLPLVRGDREEFARAMTNVLRNAVQAMHTEGGIDVSARREGAVLRITITDTGIGIPASLLPRIFEPNFSTKTEGMGLGLAIVRKIITDMDGSISIDSVEGRGTEVTILLPASAAVTDE